MYFLTILFSLSFSRRRMFYNKASPSNNKNPCDIVTSTFKTFLESKDTSIELCVYLEKTHFEEGRNCIFRELQ